MLAEYKKKTNIRIGLGTLALIVACVLVPRGAVGAILGLPFLLGGAFLFIWGCCSYAKGKGYHEAWGFLGLLSWIGLIILALFPDKHK